MPITYMNISGEVWEYVEEFGSKSAAQGLAEKLRKQGWRARVVMRSMGWTVGKSLEKRSS